MAEKNTFDYRNTVFLPKTAFPMRAKLPQREPEYLKRWEEMDLYGLLRKARKGAPLFILHDGPPYANGHIHIGHAVNKVLKDIIVRSRSMMGMNAPYVPGWDCHGLPIELKVEEAFAQQKRAKEDIPANEFRRACRKYAAHWLDVQRDEFRRLGILGDWASPYITMDYQFEADTVRELGQLLKSGNLYRGAKPVYWCVKDRTALAEAEVEYEEHSSHSIYVKFPILDPPEFLTRHHDGAISTLVWTTTPWTLPANLAVCLHPEMTYVLVGIVDAGRARNLASGEALILAEKLCHHVLSEIGADGDVIARFQGDELEHVRCRHPYLDQNSPVILGEHVTAEVGTGCVHTAPGHGLEDYEVGQRYGLPAFNPVDDAGVFCADTPVVGGMHVFKANAKIIEHLDATGALVHAGEIRHSYPHCWRCHTPLIFRATPQWFISMEKNKLRQKALEAIGKIRWFPSWGEQRIRAMVESRPDWCISRQRSWGVPIAVFSCVDCGSHAVTTPEVIERVAKEMEKGGADVWFSLDCEAVLGSHTQCPDCGGRRFKKETDILDVWFDSGSTHACVLEKREELRSPADLYLEGSDQHRGWFQSSLLESVGTRGRAPFKAVLTHGFVVDGQGNKMSKSRGNVIAPQSIIQRMGADLLRLWVASEDYAADIRISEEILKQLAESYRRIRNTIRFLLGNLDGFDPEQDVVPLADRGPLDRWVMHRLSRLCSEVRECYASYRFHRIHQLIHNFCAVDLGGFYLDVIKDRLYCDPIASPRRRSARATLHDLADALIRLIAPILPFTAEEAWDHFPGAWGASVHLHLLPEVEDVHVDEQAWQAFFALREKVNMALDQAKKDGLIGSSLAAAITLPKADLEVAERIGEPLEQLLIVAAVSSGNSIIVAPATGVKCLRCWNVGEPADPKHPVHNTLCPRCFAVVTDPDRGP